MTDKIKVIGFDADDTLWDNEPFYRGIEVRFSKLLASYLPEKESTNELFATEMQNLELYGYGAKAFTLSMIETALRITDYQVKATEINAILEMGKQLVAQPVVLFDGVEEVLKALKPRYTLILATKGDLLDQERKLKKSGLESYFHHIEVMSDKQKSNYTALIKHLDIQPDEFLMIGNSVKSDILPVIQIGGKAIHIPSEITWLHEQIHEPADKNLYPTVDKIIDILDILGSSSLLVG